MRKDKDVAISLRKEGKSYRQIRDALRIPLSTLSEWFSDEVWSKEIALKLGAEVQKTSTARIVKLDKIRGVHLDRLYKEARQEAMTDLQQLKYNPLFIAGIMLYWGEGSKSGHNVQISNSDPKLIQFYVSFLQNACGIPLEKVKAHILIYPDHEEKATRAFWSKSSGIPWENFTKSVTIQGRHKVRRLTWGVCIVTVSSTYFMEKMQIWLKSLPQELMNSSYYENIVRQGER